MPGAGSARVAPRPDGRLQAALTASGPLTADGTGSCGLTDLGRVSETQAGHIRDDRARDGTGRVPAVPLLDASARSGPERVRPDLRGMRPHVNAASIGGGRDVASCDSPSACLRGAGRTLLGTVGDPW